MKRALPLALFAVLGALPACGDTFTSSGDGAGGAGGRAGSGGERPTTTDTATDTGTSACAAEPDDCSACKFDSCQAIYCGCQSTPACGKFEACLDDAAGQELLVNQCYNNHPAGISAYVLSLSCAQKSCNVPCGVEAGGLTDCDFCSFSKCAAEANACLGDPFCRQLLVCLAKCPEGDDACLMECQANAGSGALDLVDAWGACRSAKCAGPCGL